MKKYLLIVVIVIMLLLISLSGCLKWRGFGRWSIGIYTGDSPFNFTSPENIINPILTSEDITDSPAWYIGDPFMIKENSTWYMFFEVWNYQADIAVATSNDGFEWTYQQIVLDKPITLSYPQVFKWMDEFYMIPSSYQAEGVQLYKAIEFPYDWSFEGILIEGNFNDPSIFQYDHRWWIFAESNPEGMDTLSLYYADDLRGPWIEHPESPVIEGNPNIARPGGRVLVLDDMIIRYTQDDYPTYGNQVRAFIITELTTSVYKEEEYPDNPIINASGKGWNADGMHHIDPHQIGESNWIACVDGLDADYYLTHGLDIELIK
jgi:hypothetical protein